MRKFFTLAEFHPNFIVAEFKLKFEPCDLDYEHPINS